MASLLEIVLLCIMASYIANYDSEDLIKWIKLNGLPESICDVIEGNFN